MIMWLILDTYFVRYPQAMPLLNFYCRVGKIRFFRERKSVLLKASSREHCAPRNFVLLVTLRSKSVCLTVYLHCAPNQIDQEKKNVEIKSGTATTFSVFFSDSISRIQNITTCSWNDCEQIRILKKFVLDKNQKINVQITLQILQKTFFDSLLRSCSVALICVLQQMITVQRESRNPERWSSLRQL